IMLAKVRFKYLDFIMKRDISAFGVSIEGCTHFHTIKVYLPKNKYTPSFPLHRPSLRLRHSDKRDYKYDNVYRQERITHKNINEGVSKMKETFENMIRLR
ncbi:hypothetical protein L9F63_023461, partial [Diploptera punctata]